MADYRQECNFPGCGYTGFTPHSPAHLKVIEAQQAEDRKQAEIEKKQRLFPFMEVHDETLFGVIESLDARAKEAESEYRNAFDAMIERGLQEKYLSWRRKK
jgi:hypothetical protein